MMTGRNDLVPGPDAPGSRGRSSADPVLSIRDLSVVYRTVNGDVRAVDQVSLDLHERRIEPELSATQHSRNADGAAHDNRTAAISRRVLAAARARPGAARAPRPVCACAPALASARQTRRVW